MGAHIVVQKSRKIKEEKNVVKEKLALHLLRCTRLDKEEEKTKNEMGKVFRSNEIPWLELETYPKLHCQEARNAPIYPLSRHVFVTDAI